MSVCLALSTGLYQLHNSVTGAMVRKGAFETRPRTYPPTICRELERYVESPLRQYKTRLTDCKRTATMPIMPPVSGSEPRQRLSGPARHAFPRATRLRDPSSERCAK